jgi:hypothetical protein
MAQVDMLKSKSRLLEITADLTCGVVNGRKLQVRRMIKPPWAERRTGRLGHQGLEMRTCRVVMWLMVRAVRPSQG